jgi:hypothetical protein
VFLSFRILVGSLLLLLVHVHVYLAEDLFYLLVANLYFACGLAAVLVRLLWIHRKSRLVSALLPKFQVASRSLKAQSLRAQKVLLTFWLIKHI